MANAIAVLGDCFIGRIQLVVNGGTADIESFRGLCANLYLFTSRSVVKYDQVVVSGPEDTLVIVAIVIVIWKVQISATLYGISNPAYGTCCTKLL